MSIIRSYTPRDVMVLSDYPLTREEESGIPYSEQSSTQLKDALIAAAVQEHKKKEVKYNLGLSEVCFTYMATKRPGKGDSDWLKSIVSKKNIPEGEEYIQCEWLKDVWVSKEVWKHIQNTIWQIKQVQPKLIVCAGKWSLLFFASLYTDPTAQLATIAGTKTTVKKQVYFGGLNKYRASLLTLHSTFEIPTTVVIPILTPAYHWLVRDKALIIKSDYARVAYIYGRLMVGVTPDTVLTSKRTHDIGDTKEKVVNYLTSLLGLLDTAPTKVAMDVETRQKGIDCIGICSSPLYSFTIPITDRYYEVLTEPTIATVNKTVNGKKTEVLEEVPAGTNVTKYRHYWSIEDEVEIMVLLQKVMLHPNCLPVHQNGNYDEQFYFREWKLRIRTKQDTMIQHHVLYNYMQKDLALLASMYCSDFVYWKGEIADKDDNVRRMYCGKDTAYTLSISNVLERFLAASSPALQEFYTFQQTKASAVVTTLMNRGVDVDVELKNNLYNQFTELMEGCLEKLRYVFNEPEFNPNSTPQVKAAFKTLLGIKPLVNRKTKAESFGADAMLVYLEEYPEWRALLTLFLEYKSIKVFVRTFLGMKLSEDGKLRCSYGVAGTKTYRLNSRKDLDGYGGNLNVSNYKRALVA
jgi:hypothetical protein